MRSGSTPSHPLSIRPAPARPIFLFDIDGTLLRPGIRVHGHSFAAALRQIYGVDGTIDFDRTAGRTDAFILADTLRGLGVDEATIERRRLDAYAFMANFVERNLGDLSSTVLPGVRDLLQELRPVGLIGLLTGNLHAIALSKLKRAGILDFFEGGGFGEESEVRADLVPVAVADVLRSSGPGVTAGVVVVVGDTPFDVEAAHAHGALAAVVSTGVYSYEELRGSGADLLMRSFASDDAAASLKRLATEPHE